VKRTTVFLALLVGLLFLAACAPAAAEEPAGQPLVEGDAGQILVYASPT
jgi:hypothetical protein